MAAVRDTGEAGEGRVPFLCECGGCTCEEWVWLTPADYDDLVADPPAAPALAAGHPRRSVHGDPSCGCRCGHAPAYRDGL
jgi:hypothetical protein